MSDSEVLGAIIIVGSIAIGAIGGFMWRARGPYIYPLDDCVFFAFIGAIATGVMGMAIAATFGLIR